MVKSLHDLIQSFEFRECGNTNLELFNIVTGTVILSDCSYEVSKRGSKSLNLQYETTYVMWLEALYLGEG
jgi:hypothetical protein